MHYRFRAGWRGLALATAVAAIVLLPALDAFSAGFGPARPGAADEEFGSPTPSARQPLLYPRSNYVWPFEAGPVYGEVDASRWSEPGVLHTIVGSFDLSRGLPLFPAALRASVKFASQPAQYFLLQVHPDAFADGTFDAIRASVESSGGAFVQEMPVGGFVVRLTAAGHAGIQGLGAVRALEPYHGALKLSPAIGRIPLTDPVKALSEVYTLELRIFPGEDVGAVSAALSALGGSVQFTTADTVVVDIHRNKLAAVAALEPVHSVHERTPLFLQGEETATTMQTGNYNSGAQPYRDAGIDGSGGGIAGASAQILAIIDSGIQFDAGDLSDTRTNAAPHNNAVNAAHRKVRWYSNTSAFPGGGGDLLGCDLTTSGGYTHGHMVAQAALGNATQVNTATYGQGWQGTDIGGNPWGIDGVAKGAKLIAYDAQVTPASGLGCDDPNQSGLAIGDLYTRPSSGSMPQAYTNGARIWNFSFGARNANVYGGDATDVDQFLFDNKDAMVFISAGNGGQDTNADGIPDPNTVSTPATAKSAVVVGASFSANNSGTGPNSRVGFSSVGPVVGGRVAPILMAPGADAGGLGMAAEYSCRSLDNDQNNPVQCDIAQGLSGTSFSSPLAAGSAVLVRDYFAQGFYPDGTSANSGNAADQVANVSGALVKAILIASADWMNSFGADQNLPGGGLTNRWRFNNEQGYGRIQLNNVLKITTYNSPAGLIVCDGGIGGGICSTSGIDGNADPNTTDSYPLEVLDRSQELRIALAWIEDSGQTLTKNLDLELLAPSGRTYRGNYFTDDNNRNNVLDAGENCDYTSSVPWPPPTTGELDHGPWSIPTCANSVYDTANPTEAIILSPDPKGDGILDNPATTGIDEGADNQLETGTWTLRVHGRSFTGAQPYAVAIAGPVGLGSSVRLQRVRPDGQLATGSFVCNDKARIIVNEVTDGTDTGVNNNSGEISSRTILQVWSAGPDGVFGTDAAPGDDVLQDQETGITFTDADGAGAGLRYDSTDLFLTDGTAPDPGNGALDVRSGQLIRVIYRDKTSGSFDTNKRRVGEAVVDCRSQIASGGVVWGQFGRNATTFINGGCERDARGLFTFGFPDKYMDADEVVGYRIAFQSVETAALTDVAVSLKAVAVDGDSPKTCKPNTTGQCNDPNRANNPVSPHVTILQPNQVLGRINPNSAVSANFTVQMASSIPANTEIEMVLGVSARKSGKPVESFVVARHRLDVDEVSFFYSTDFPAGGSENRDINNDETIQNPTTSGNDFEKDYYFENRTFSSLTATGRNTSIQSPWNFDTGTTSTGSQGWRVGITNNTTQTLATLAQWGEDKNFNNILDPGEDRDPANGVLDHAWGTRGGCGWQTRTTGTTGGVWHTGRIDVTSLANCLVGGNTSGQCQRYETVAGFFGNNVWLELLLSPEFEKVNQCVTGTEVNCAGRQDQTEDPVFQVEFMWWGWNTTLDIPDTLTGLLWELDTDTEKREPIDLFNDFGFLNFVFGVQGPRSGGNAPITDGFNLFANVSKCVDTDGNGTVDKCGNISGVACTSDTQCTGNTFNGTQGNNRNGKNACWFEGKTSGVINAREPYGLALPADDDKANGYCARNDALNTIDRTKSCTTATAAFDCVGPAFTGVCTVADAVIDEYVTANGPIRNLDIADANGPDMRFTVLEDFYGDSGRKFQAAFGFYTQEGTPSGLPSNTGFGAAIDDPVIEWREFRLDADTTNCGTGASGECASLELSQTNMFEGSTLINITVIDRFPYNTGNAATGVNDCNNDGDFVDPEDDNDCNNDGTPDIVVRVLSQGEPGGELAYLNKVASQPRYTGTFPVSFAFNSPGSLYLTPANPVARVQYKDVNDGTGAICGNATLPEQRGVLEESTAVVVSAGRVGIRGFRLVELTGDMDGFADDGEEIQLFLTLTNKSGVDIDDTSVSIQAANAATAARLACISRPTVSLGSLLNKQFKETPTPFLFTVGNVGRTDPNAAELLTFLVTVRSNRFDATTRTLEFSLDTDLNASGGGTATSFLDDFEVTSGLSQFTTQSLDAGRETLSGSDGFRCQYNDPDGPNTNSPGRTSCWMGTTSNAFDWHIHDNQNGVSRAFTGTRSLHWGVHPATGGAARDTARFAQLDAAALTNPINLATAPAVNPELTFRHQISLMDSRGTNTPAGESADRGVVHVRMVDNGGTPISDWVKIFAYENEYDVRGTDQFSNCTFDPVDDGNNEDSFFDPSDPFRRQGPSSTCDPEFVFGFAGDTDYRSSPPDLNKIGRAFDGPGLAGSAGPGTWVQPKFNLNRYKGRRLLMRFLATSIEVSGAVTYNDTNIGSNNNVADDGWYVDRVEVSGLLTSPVTLSADTANLSPTGCNPCTTITPSLVPTPATSPAPGQPVSLSAAGSSANSCLNGSLQYRFFQDLNSNTTYEPGVDTLLRDWTDNAVLLDAPLNTTRYGVVVRCSSDTACANSTVVNVPVNCPSTGSQVSYFNGNIFVKKGAPEVTWTTSQMFDAVQINGNTLRSTAGDFNAAKESCVQNDGSGTSLNWNPAVSPGDWKAILLRPAGGTFCNASGSYSANHPKEAPGRDSEIGSICP